MQNTGAPGGTSGRIMTHMAGRKPVESVLQRPGTQSIIKMNAAMPHATCNILGNWMMMTAMSSVRSAI